MQCGKQSKKISVIIPIYNAEKFLAECLDSVVSQSIEEKEIICIDDGSSDGSGRILEQYQKKYGYIRVLRQENKGAGEAKNVGLANAVGKYVCFLDADDFYIVPDALEKMVHACESRKVGACAALIKLYGEERTEDFYLYRECFKDGGNPDGKVMDYREHQDDYGYTAYIFSLEMIKENGIAFPAYRRYEDPPFLLKTMTAIRKYMVLPVEFYGYRFTGETVSRKGMYIKDTLRGIRDNFILARKEHLGMLEKILVHRIDSEYARWIIGSADKDILGLLCEMREAARGEGIWDETAREQEISLELMRSVVAGNVNGCNLGAYFEKEGICTVAIYGLGAFGKIVVSELGKLPGISLYGIDRNVREMEGVEVVSLEEANKMCKDIIVTPIKKNEDIVCHIRGFWAGMVWGLQELLYIVEKECV